VNGAPVQGTCVLGHEDVIRIGEHEFRLDLGAARPVPGGAALGATELMPGVGEGRRAQQSPGAGAAAPASAPAPALALAVLEVTRGASARKAFRVERAACAIGRSDENDVRIPDNSVSALHATLVLKRGTWYVVDLQSANGTYVDGYRVAGERAVPDGAALRVGDVVMRFRVLAPTGDKSSATRPPGGLLRRLRNLLQS
jgi:hypothetical protein